MNLETQIILKVTLVIFVSAVGLVATAMQDYSVVSDRVVGVVNDIDEEYGLQGPVVQAAAEHVTLEADSTQNK